MGCPARIPTSLACSGEIKFKIKEGGEKKEESLCKPVLWRKCTSSTNSLAGKGLRGVIYMGAMHHALAEVLSLHSWRMALMLHTSKVEKTTLNWKYDFWLLIIRFRVLLSDAFWRHPVKFAFTSVRCRKDRVIFLRSQLQCYFFDLPPL